MNLNSVLISQIGSLNIYEFLPLINKVIYAKKSLKAVSTFLEQNVFDIKNVQIFKKKW